MKNKIIYIALNIFFIGTLLSQPAEAWERIYRSVYSNDAGKKVAVDGLGNIFTASTTYMSGDIVKAKCFVTKNEPSGFLRSKIKINFDSVYNDYMSDMVVDQAGNCYVTGYTVTPGSYAVYFTYKLNSDFSVAWRSVYGGTSGISGIATAIAVDAGGNVYVTGSGYNNSNYSDYTTVKYNSSGVQQWAVNYNGPSNMYDDPVGIDVDPSSGNVVVTGSSYGGSATEYDIATVEYGPSGNLIWVQRYSGPAYSDFAKAVATDISGNVYVTGYSTGVGTGYDYVTLKYNSKGNQLWVQRYNGPANGHDYPYDIKVSKSGDVCVTGSSAGVNNESDITTVEYNSSGTLQWVQRFAGIANSTNYANSMALDYKGNIIVTGSYYSAQSGYDQETIKYNPAGVLQWSATYNGGANSTDNAYSVAADPSGNVVVTGYTTNNYTGQDIVTIKYDYHGVQQWRQVLDGAANEYDQASSVYTDPQGNIYITGYNSEYRNYAVIKYNTSGAQQWVQKYPTTSSASPAPRIFSVVDKFGNSYVTASYRYPTHFSVVTMKYNSSGVRQWLSFYADSTGNSAASCQPMGIAIDSSGNVLVAGWECQTIGAITGNNMTLKYSSSGILQWADIYSTGGSSGDLLFKIAADPAGNVYVTGGNGNYVTIKYSPSGGRTWVNIYRVANQGSSHGTDIAIDPSGNICITGGDWSENSWTIYDFAVLKYSSSGNLLWVSRHPGNDLAVYDRIRVKTDNSGNVYMAGTINGYTAGDYFTVKYNPSGIEQWVVNYNGPINSSDIFADIALDAAGNVFITGRSCTRSYNGYDFTTLKYNSAGVLQWTISHDGPADGVSSVNPAMALDSYGNLFITGTKSIGVGNLASMTVKYSQVSNKPVFHKDNVNNKGTNLPRKFEMYKNYPNPFNPNTIIKYDLPQTSVINIVIYDILGKEVTKLVNNEFKEAGSYEAVLDGSGLSSGIYFYKISATDPAGNHPEYFTKTLKMILLK